MTQFLRQSTQVVVRIGPFLDVNDAFTPETGVTLSGADEAELLKAAGAATVSIAAATFAAISGADGWYDLTLTASHTDTVGTLDVVVQDDSLFLPVSARFQVVEEAVYDDLYATGATGGGSGATPAEVNAEMVDVLSVDTVTLPGQGAPTVTPTIEEMLAWLYKTFRNKKEQTTGEWRLYDDAGTTVDSKATVSDAGGVTTKEEIATGP